MKGLLIIKNGKEGYVATPSILYEEAQSLALAAVRNNYPDTSVYDAWTLTAWWVMEEDDRPFFGPQPWPLAAFYMEDKMIEVMGKIPNYLVIFDWGRGGFDHMKFDNLEEARRAVLEIIGPHGGKARDVTGGIVFVFTDPEGAEHEVGFAIKVTK